MLACSLLYLLYNRICGTLLPWQLKLNRITRSILWSFFFSALFVTRLSALKVRHCDKVSISLPDLFLLVWQKIHTSSVCGASVDFLLEREDSDSSGDSDRNPIASHAIVVKDSLSTRLFCSLSSRVFIGVSLITFPMLNTYRPSVPVIFRLQENWVLANFRCSFQRAPGSWMTTYSGKSCSFGLLLVPFVNCRQFMYLVISLLVLRAGCGIWLYQFLITAYHFTSIIKTTKVALSFSYMTYALCPARFLSCNFRCARI